MDSRTGSRLPTVVCFALVACILGVKIDSRWQSVTDRPTVKASARSEPSKVVEAVMDARPTADSNLSLAGPQRGIEFRILNRNLVVSSPTEIGGCCGPEVTKDIQLDIELVRGGSGAKDEPSSPH